MGRGGRVPPYKDLTGTGSQPWYVFRDFCLKKGIDFIIVCLNPGIDFINFVLKLKGYLFLDDKQPARIRRKGKQTAVTNMRKRC